MGISAPGKAPQHSSRFQEERKEAAADDNSICFFNLPNIFADFPSCSL